MKSVISHQMYMLVSNGNEITTNGFSFAKQAG